MHETFASCGWYCPAAHAVHAVTSPPGETYLPRGHSEYSQRVLRVLTWGTLVLTKCTLSTQKGFSHRYLHGLLGALSKGNPCRRHAPAPPSCTACAHTIAMRVGASLCVYVGELTPG